MKRLTSAGIVFILIFFATYVQAQSVPPLVNYQGMLTEANGDPIADTTAKLEFNLYDAASNGTNVWGPQIFDGVPVVKGKFNIILGPADNNGKSIADAFNAAERFLGIKMNDQVEISPRQQILSAPYAINADTLDGKHAADIIPSGGIIMWSGPINNIPEGWALCDGTNGTPNLLSRSLSDLSDPFNANV